MDTFLSHLKRYLPLILILALGFWLVPDPATAQVTVARLAAVGLVLLLAILTLGWGATWGILPDLDAPYLFREAGRSSAGSGLVLLGLLVLLAAIVVAVAR